MNERIKQLAIEAGYLPDMFGVGHWDMPECQKFALLIIRECARIAIEKQTKNDVFNIVSENPAKDFAYALVEHFGVKE